MNEPCISCNAKRCKNERREAMHIQVKFSGPSYSDLPSNIVENILLRLSVKRISVCKCVCKTWNDLVSNPEFAKLHFNQAQVYPLIQTSAKAQSRMVYLVQLEQGDFELKLGCYHPSLEHKLGCDCKVEDEHVAQFRLPLRNFERIVNGKNDGEFKCMCETGRNNCLKLNMKDHKYKIVNSCNGLLCLSDPCNNEPVIVCNPITGEFIYVPKERKHGYCVRVIACALGFSPMTNQYKVMRIVKTPSGVIGVEIHILGTNSWNYRKDFQYSAVDLVFPTYLNGYLYWFSFLRHSVMFFDLEKYSFGWLSAPSSEFLCGNSTLSLGVLGGELCFLECSDNGGIVVWVMKDCDGQKDWLKMHSMNVDGNEEWPSGSYKPIKYLNNGALLLYDVDKQAFLYHNPKKLGYRYLKIHGVQSGAEAISHIPSFVLLKDAVSGLNTTVLNVRCGELKLHEDGKRISIVEQIREHVESDVCVRNTTPAITQNQRKGDLKSFRSPPASSFEISRFQFYSRSKELYQFRTIHAIRVLYC